MEKLSNNYYIYPGSILVEKKCTEKNNTCYHYVIINGRYEFMHKDRIRSLLRKKRIKLNQHFDIVKIKLLSGCMSAFPCKHLVSIKETSPRIMDAMKIKKYYERFNLEIPDHFKSY